MRGEPAQFTQSKMLCAVALDRAVQLTAEGTLPERKMEARWRGEAAAIRGFVDAHCWSDRQHSYVRAASSEQLDASLLLAVLHGYASPEDARMRQTVDAVARELADGPFVRRYTAGDGLSGSEGAFLACSFWLAEALARTGRADAAVGLMEKLLDLANDVGLYSEEIDPQDGDLLGNTPQALSHLALISAANAIDEAQG